MFEHTAFEIIASNARTAPRRFSYFTDQDALADVMEPGYFNGDKDKHGERKPPAIPSMSYLLAPNSLIDVVTKDFTGILVVGEPKEGVIHMDKERVCIFGPLDKTQAKKSKPEEEKKEGWFL